MRCPALVAMLLSGTASAAAAGMAAGRVIECPPAAQVAGSCRQVEWGADWLVRSADTEANAFWGNSAETRYREDERSDAAVRDGLWRKAEAMRGSVQVALCMTADDRHGHVVSLLRETVAVCGQERD